MCVDKEVEWSLIYYMVYSFVRNEEIDIIIDGMNFYINDISFLCSNNLTFRCFEGREEYTIRRGLDFKSIYRSKLDILYRRCMSAKYPHCMLLLYYFWGSYFNDFVYNGNAWDPVIKKFIKVVYAMVESEE